MKYFIETYGCQMNVHDSERMAGLLEQSGYDPAESDRDADIVVVNTCSVRERAEEKLYTRLGEIKEMSREIGRDPLVVVAGCVAQQEGDKLIKRSKGVVDLVVGTQQVKMLPMLVEDRGGATGADRTMAGRRPALARRRAHRDREPVRGAVVPAGHRPARRSGPRLRDNYRGLQRFLRFLCRAVYPWARAHAVESRDTG